MVSISLLMVVLGCVQIEDPLVRARSYLQKNPKKALHYLSSQPEEKQIFIILQLAEEMPMQIGPLCAALKLKSAKLRCQKIAQRPHLWTPSHTPPPKPIPQCPHPHLCIQEEAIILLHKGSLPKAQQKCLEIEDNKWAQECIFHMGELHLQKSKENLRVVTHMCKSLDIFQEECLQHVVFSYAKHLSKEDHSIETMKQ